MGGRRRHGQDLAVLNDLISQCFDVDFGLLLSMQIFFDQRFHLRRRTDSVLGLDLT